MRPFIRTILTFLAMSSVSYAQQTPVPDPNFEQALIDLGYDSGAVDGFVLTANIESVIDLDIENRGISDLTGIEDFTTLSRLHCPLNNISTLNITQNIALEYLNCYGNQLTSLDISQNTNLLDLLCYNNSITNLDLSNNLVLRQLNTSNNGHNTLDVSFNTDLTSLIASTNNLTSIDVSQNTLLESLNIRSNNLTVIDVSQNVVLDQLTCGDNPLTSLEITQNTVLRRLSVFETAISSLNTSQNTLLEELDITSNTVTSLNLSQNTELTHLNTGYNQLTDIDLSQNLALTNINVGGNQLLNLDVSQNTALTSLNCEANDLSSLNLGQNTFLAELICRNNELTNLDVSQNSVLSLLFCNGNMLTTLNLNQNTALAQLNCDSNELNTLDVSNSTSLIELRCSFNRLTNLDVSPNVNLELLRCNNNRLNNLNIKNGNNTNIDIQFGFSAINNSGLDCIEVDDAAYSTANWTAIDPFASFSEDCPFNDGLTFVPDDNFEQALIDLNYDSGPLDNQVFTEDIRLITSLIVNNKNISDLTGIEDFLSLTILNVSNNVLTNLEISQNLALENLFCDSNQLTSLEVSANTALESLNCGFNQLTVLNLSANSVLGQLNTSSNQLTTLDLSQNTALFQIRCSLNQLTSLNVRNGNNSNVSDINFSANFNPGLECVQVDDTAYSAANWSQIDFQTEFNEDCGNAINFTFVPDDNFEQALIDLGHDSGPLNDQVPTGNINTLASLAIDDYDIADLTGIEDFTALQLLSCNNNQLTTVDLSSNTILTGVFFSDNQLVSFSLKNGNTAAFEDVFTTGNPNLICIEVDDPTYATTNLSDNIDVQTNFNEDCSAAFTYVPDDNFEQALIDLGYDTGPLNDYVPTANINTVTSLDLSGGSISDLTGISDFSALTMLTAYENELTTIDVSQNPILEYLDLFDNQLTSLDLSQNTQLTFLVCSQNQLSTLDLSQLPLLNDLTCGRNQLTSLNVQNGNNSNFISFGAEDNPNLTCIQVDDAAYSTANWNYIDPGTVFSINCATLSDLTYVPDDNFEQALIDLGYDVGPLNDYVPTANINTITDLFVWDASISDLTGIEDFTALTSLYAYNNSLTSIDVSQNLALEYLDVFNNQLTELDLSQNTELNFLSCSQNQLNALDLSQLPLLADLTCGRNRLTSLNVQNGNNVNFTGFGAEDNPNLTCIQVDDATYSTGNWNYIDPQTSFSEDCSAPVGQTYVPDDNFEQALINLGYDVGPLNDFVPTANIETVVDLDISTNSIADLTGIEDFTAITTLNCSGNTLSILEVSQNTALRTLYASDNVLTAINLSQNTMLVTLDIHNNQLAYLDLSQNTELVSLACYQNQLSVLDLSQLPLLGEFSADNNDLNSLIIKNGNNIGILYFSVVSNPNLTCIEVDNTVYSQTNWTNIDPQTSFSEDCNAVDMTFVPDDNFEQALIDLGYDAGPLNDFVPTANINTVVFLDVRNRNIIDLTGIEDFLDLDELLCGNNQITDLDISSNTALTSLSCSNNALLSLNTSQNTALTNLGCHNNQISSLDLSQNTLLTTFFCHGNDLTDIDVSALVDLRVFHCYDNQLTALDIVQNTALFSLDVQDNQLTSLNLSQHPILTQLICADNQLTNLNVRNGNNSNFTSFDAINNPNLICIEVDNVTYAQANWTAIDSQTGFSENCNDTTAPVITLNGANPQTIELGAGYTELGATTDDGSPVTIDASEFMDAVGTYTIYYNATDTSGNIATEVTRTVNVVETDTTAPVITLNGANPQTIELGAGYTELGATTDDGSPVTIDASEFMDVVGTYTIYYNATDASGNIAMEVTRTVNVVETDTTAPVITLNGANPQTIELGAGYTELGATTDDGSAVTIDASEFMDAVGTYTIYYNATDGSGNVAMEVTRTVNVVETDTNAPIITLNGANPQTIELGAGYTELGATTDDGSAITIDASEFIDAVGTYTIYYNATDSSGNIATEVTRTVNVVETDTTAPVITLNGANPQTIELGAGYTELGATTDDGSPVTIDASEFMDAVGTYTIYYNATDTSGNIATEVTRTVNVVETDTTAPVITLNGANPQTIELGAGYTELGATTDDGSPVTIDASEFMDAVGSYTIYYNAVDTNGNVAVEVVRMVTVIDSDAAVEVAKGFSPNGDAVGDSWVIENLQNFPDHEVVVYNRWGNTVFESRDYQNNWEGTSRTSGGSRLPVGPYLYIIQFNDAKTPPLQGWVYINY